MPDGTVPAEFEKLVHRYGLEDTLAHPPLEPRDRSLVALTACAMAGTEAELAACVAEASSNGVTEPEMAEVFLNLAVLAGLPVARQAFAVAQRTLAWPGPGPGAGPGAG
jgi:alkylhydroperoxidase/carboxymuconolactone decarboxylase family protein YurZ